MSPVVPRFAHGSRVPGWDDAVDLDKDPATIPDVAVTPVPPGLRAEIDAAMSRYPDRRSAAIPALHAAQALHGWCSPEAIDQVAAVMRVTPAYLASIATFYDMFDTAPLGRHRVWVCQNISCSLRGADAVLAAIEDAAEGVADLQVRGFECLGACDIAPMASIDGDYIGPLTPDDAPEIVAAIAAGRAVLPDRSIARRSSVDPGALRDETERRSTVLPPEGDAEDRPGPTAAVELTQDHDDQDGG